MISTAVDVASDDEVKAWAGRLLSSHGPPDLVLNNAGVINKNARLWEIGAREFSQVIDVNIKGIANVIRHFVSGDDQAQARRYRELQLRLGSLH